MQAIFVIFGLFLQLSFAAELKVTTIVNEPFASTNGTGFIYDLLKLLSQKTSDTFKISLVADSKYGSKKEDGKWSGMIGEIIDRKANIAVAPLTVTSGRLQDVDFTHPYMSFGLGILIKRPSGSSKMQIADLLDDDSIKLFYMKGGSTEQKLKSSEDPLLKKILKKTNDKDNLATVAAGYDKVKSGDGKFGFVIEEPSGLYYTIDNCDFQLVALDSHLKFSNYALALFKGDSRTREFSKSILELEESGEMQTLAKKWFFRPSSCPKVSFSSKVVSSLGLSLLLIFMVYM